MHAGRLVSAVAIAILTAAAAGRAQIRERDRDWVAPASPASKINPLAGRTGVQAGGEKLFRQRCKTCHGADGRGSDRAPDVTAADVQTQSDGALFWKISGGNTRGGMPAFSFLPDLQRWQLVMQLRVLARRSEAERYPVSR